MRLSFSLRDERVRVGGLEVEAFLLDYYARGGRFDDPSVPTRLALEGMAPSYASWLAARAPHRADTGDAVAALELALDALPRDRDLWVALADTLLEQRTDLERFERVVARLIELDEDEGRRPDVTLNHYIERELPRWKATRA